jgi:hypothetical protein
VNQNQTYRHEVGGHYLWSPKRKKNGHHNPFYEAMREVSPGDVVLSFFDTRIAAIGVVKSYCYESPKPSEFGAVGANWNEIGWRIESEFIQLQSRPRPKDFIQELAPHLPTKYSPLRATGDGLQQVYLAEINASAAAVIFKHIGPESEAPLRIANVVGRSAAVSPAPEPLLEEWEHREEARLSEDGAIDVTTRSALIQARRGQGIFRKNVQGIESACRVTRVDRPEHLVASHIQPWRNSSNDERLDGENGLLLTPTVDHLFDKGFISFENSGAMIVSPVADSSSLARMGIDPASPPNVGVFSAGQRHFLDYHRGNVLRMMHR